MDLEVTYVNFTSKFALTYQSWICTDLLYFSILKPLNLIISISKKIFLPALQIIFFLHSIPFNTRWRKNTTPTDSFLNQSSVLGNCEPGTWNLDQVTCEYCDFTKFVHAEFKLKKFKKKIPSGFGINHLKTQQTV